MDQAFTSRRTLSCASKTHRCSVLQYRRAHHPIRLWRIAAHSGLDGPVQRVTSDTQRACMNMRTAGFLARKKASKFAPKASGTRQDVKKSDAKQGASTFAAAVSIAVVVVTGVANRVLYKLALVPMGDYVFVLSQFQTFGYCLVYFSFLAARFRSGQVTKEMLDVTDKKLFVGIGIIEAASSLLGFIGASKLPGVTLPLLQQSIIIFQLLLSGLFLKKKLLTSQIVGAIIVIAGVCTAAFPSDAGAGIFAQAPMLYIAVFVASMGFPAFSSSLKEKIFGDAKEKLGGQDLDIFVVNSLGSAAQAVAVFLLLPVLTSVRGLSLSQLPQYISDGISAFRGLDPAGGAANNGAPLLPVLYVTMNLVYNISLLNLLRTAGAVVQTLTNSSLTPLTILAFCLPLPYLADKAEPSAQLFFGSVVLVAGLLTYNSAKWRPWLQEKLDKK